MKAVTGRGTSMRKNRELLKIADLQVRPCPQTHTPAWQLCPLCLMVSGNTKSSQNSQVTPQALNSHAPPNSQQPLF